MRETPPGLVLHGAKWDHLTATEQAQLWEFYHHNVALLPAGTTLVSWSVVVSRAPECRFGEYRLVLSGSVAPED